jgi:GNAT superfamily N-acetyltransferase
MIEISQLGLGDRDAWEVLARGYKEFYRNPLPDEAYEVTWRRLTGRTDGVDRTDRANGTNETGEIDRTGKTELYALGARLDGRLAGITHYLFHPMVWAGEACYLQDLFVDAGVRGRGAARALIEGVAQAARRRGADRLYWTTQEDNARARALYDKVARYNGFIRYDYPLTPVAPRTPVAP